MPRRTSPPQSAFVLVERGVYVQPFTVKGCYEIVAISSRGEQVAVRYVKEGRSTRTAESELWADLDELDPTLPHLRGPYLHLT